MFDGCSLDRRLLFLEPPQGEVHRIYLPRTRMNKGWEEPRVERRASIVALDDLRYISLYGGCSIVLRLTKKEPARYVGRQVHQESVVGDPGGGFGRRNGGVCCRVCAQRRSRTAGSR